MRATTAVRTIGALLIAVSAGAWLAAGMSGPGAREFGGVPEAPSTSSARPAEEDIEQPAPTVREATEDDVGGAEEPVAPPPFTSTAPRGAVDRTTWPVQVSIAQLRVDAAVLPVGVGGEGALIVPDSPMEVGWYQGGAVPGEPGVALLTSHVDTRTEGRGVFAGLVSLEAGDTIGIVAADGTAQRWRVTARTQHLKTELPPTLFARSGTPMLALVTCGGPFDRELRSYRDNVIVWAEPLG